MYLLSLLSLSSSGPTFSLSHIFLSSSCLFLILCTYLASVPILVPLKGLKSPPLWLHASNRTWYVQLFSLLSWRLTFVGPFGMIFLFSAYRIYLFMAYTFITAIKLSSFHSSETKAGQEECTTALILGQVLWHRVLSHHLGGPHPIIRVPVWIWAILFPFSLLANEPGKALDTWASLTLALAGCFRHL